MVIVHLNNKRRLRKECTKCEKREVKSGESVILTFKKTKKKKHNKHQWIHLESLSRSLSDTHIQNRSSPHLFFHLTLEIGYIIMQQISLLHSDAQKPGKIQLLLLPRNQSNHTSSHTPPLNKQTTMANIWTVTAQQPSSHVVAKGRIVFCVCCFSRQLNIERHVMATNSKRKKLRLWTFGPIAPRV